MSAIAAIRTNRWTDEEERMLATLQMVDGLEVTVVFHNRAGDVVPPVPVVDVNDDVMQGMGLATPSDWGWRCGDYFYYALRAARPEYDHYWLVEPDVLFTGDPTGFFAAFDGDNSDLLGIDPRPEKDRSHPFLETLQHLDPYRTIFALTRFSGRALDRLVALRRENGRQKVSWRGFANDEYFTFSHAHADPDLSIGNLVAGAPGWFDGARFRTDPDLLITEIEGDPALADKVFHPVKSHEHWKASVATRLSNKTAFLRRMKPTLDCLSARDVADIADMARANVLAAIEEVRDAGAQAERHPVTRPELTLPEEEADAVREAYEGAGVILEYGSGGSTVLAAEMPGKRVFSVESDPAWAEMMQGWFATNPPAKGSAVDVIWADIGPTKAWGFPADDSGWARYADYPLGIWDMEGFIQPDVVLVDGRFRTGCALATALRTEKPVQLLVDDYLRRKQYHRIEEFLGKPGIIGRMAEFEVEPMAIPPARLREVIGMMTRP